VEHGLSDVLRSWLAVRPRELEAIRVARPDGPLAISHFTGRSGGSLGTPHRYDSIWATPEFEVADVSYLYDEAVAAGSDHAAVVVDLQFAP
jgi:hypothetical protein